MKWEIEQICECALPSTTTFKKLPLRKNKYHEVFLFPKVHKRDIRVRNLAKIYIPID